MVITLLAIVVGSFIARALFKYCISERFDLAGEFKNGIPDIECKKIFNLKGIWFLLQCSFKLFSLSLDV